MMNVSSLIKTALVLAGMLLIAGASVRFWGWREPVSEAARYAQTLDELKLAANRPVRFAGRVEDRDGRPIEGVEVVVASSRMSKLLWFEVGLVPSEFRLRTDRDGIFVLEGRDGEAAFGISAKVQEVRKSGYEFMRRESASVVYDAMYEPAPTREKPRRLVMRKLGEAGLVVQFSRAGYMVGDGGWWEFDPLRAVWLPEGDSVLRDGVKYFEPMLKIACHADEERGELVLKVAMMGEGAGGGCRSQSAI